MVSFATDGSRLCQLIRMAIPLCRAAGLAVAGACPGAPPTYHDWQIAVLIMVAIIKRRKNKSSQYRFLYEYRREFIGLLGMEVLPARSTYFSRYRKAYHLFQRAIVLQGRLAIKEGLVDASTVAVDKSLVAAPGRPWPRYRRRRPRGADPQARFGFSKHHGWVYGYSFEVIVAASGPLVFPLVASADVASCSECRSFAPKVPLLPKQTKNVLADRGYDSNANGEAVEYDLASEPTGRHFVCPLQARAGKPKVGRYPHRGQRGRLNQHRAARLKFYESPAGKQLYALRSKTVEPFNEWFKNRFDLMHQAWHRGLDNNRTQILAALFAYQLLVRYNHHQNKTGAQIQWILDTI